MQTVLDVLKKTEAYFKKAGIETSKIDAEWLLAHGLKCKRLELFLQHERPLTEEELEGLRPLVKRRAQREPLQYILGSTEFYGLEISLKEGVLIPRPETEELVDLVLARIPKSGKFKIIDLGTGTGAIAMAIAKERSEAIILGIDFSDTALLQAKENVNKAGLGAQVSIRKGDWLNGIDARVDWIISNPPYLSAEEWEQAAPEVKLFEPKTSLVSEEQGLADAKKILSQSAQCLNKHGKVAFELGVGHPQQLVTYAEQLGFGKCETLTDIHRRERFFLAEWME